MNNRSNIFTRSYFIMNFALGGDWSGRDGVDRDICPQTMEVDYIRVYQLK